MNNIINEKHEKFKKLSSSKWNNRRRITYLSLMFFAGVVAYILMIRPPEDAVSFEFVLTAVTTIVSVIVVSYFGGSTAEVFGKRHENNMSEFEYFEESQGLENQGEG